MIQNGLVWIFDHSAIAIWSKPLGNDGGGTVVTRLCHGNPGRDRAGGRDAPIESSGQHAYGTSPYMADPAMLEHGQHARGTASVPWPSWP